MSRLQVTDKGGVARRAPRRLTAEARRLQLLGIAMAVVAEKGLSEFSLDEIAERADVTRNLLYHYFPRGRADLVVAVADRAGHELTDGWVIDENIPIEERQTANNARIVAQALQPTDAWRIYRLVRGTPVPELREIHDRFVDLVVANMSLNQLGTPDPPEIARIALRGYLAFVETVLDDMRAGAVPAEQIVLMLNETLAAAIRAASAARTLPAASDGRQA